MPVILFFFSSKILFYLKFAYADKGLGKDNQGIKTALKPILKFDTRGVGCNQKDEYSSEFKWWEYSYNRAAKKISQSESENKKRKHKDDNEEKESSNKTIYSRFEKVCFHNY